MIPEAKALKVIKIYFYICKRFEEDLKYCCARHSNNSNPDLSDQEIMTIYLFCVTHEQRFKIKHIHQFAIDYMRSWFPSLGSYQAFNNRLNRLSEAFRLLMIPLLEDNKPNDCYFDQSLLDSMPIITCSGKRTPKVATEITNKGVCFSKGIYYHGLKLHALAFRRNGKLPFPEQLVISPASDNDLTVFKDYWSDIEHRTFWGDKIYIKHDYFENLKLTCKSEMLTPVKAVKGQAESLKQRNKAADDLFSKAVSKVRQPIEGFFNWLIEKTDFQKACKVRSTKGLLVHVFGKLSAAFINLIF